MYFELNRHPAQVPRTKIEFWGGLISDLEHCALAPPRGSKKFLGGFRHLVRSNPCHLAQETSQNHHLGLLSPPSVLSWRDVPWDVIGVPNSGP